MNLLTRNIYFIIYNVKQKQHISLFLLDVFCNPYCFLFTQELIITDMLQVKSTTFTASIRW